MDNITFEINEKAECIDGEIFYYKNEFIFETNSGKGEFSLMLGKGYCQLSIAKFNSRVYSFDGMNWKEDWINKKLTFPQSVKGELYINNIYVESGQGNWYVENWNTYYDKKNNFICIGNCTVNQDDVSVEFCKNIVATIGKGKLKSIWIRDIIFKS